MKSMKPKIIKAVSILLALLSVIGATVPAQALNPVVSQGGSEPVIVEEDISFARDIRKALHNERWRQHGGGVQRARTLRGGRPVV